MLGVQASQVTVTTIKDRTGYSPLKYQTLENQIEPLSRVFAHLYKDLPSRRQTDEADGIQKLWDSISEQDKNRRE